MRSVNSGRRSGDILVTNEGEARRTASGNGNDAGDLSIVAFFDGPIDDAAELSLAIEEELNGQGGVAREPDSGEPVVPLAPFPQPVRFSNAVGGLRGQKVVELALVVVERD